MNYWTVLSKGGTAMNKSIVWIARIAIVLFFGALVYDAWGQDSGVLYVPLSVFKEAVGL